MERFKMPVAVHLLLIQDDKILLIKRFNTGYCDNMFSLPAGHVEKGENVRDAMIRETKEEINIDVSKKLKIVQVMNRKGTDQERIDYFFLAKKWKGIINNNEPNKCSLIKWVNIDKLPKNTISYVKYAIEMYLKKEKFTMFDW
jgi:ADP-ribose pyrophosphatase YjhB (NUDIX family)